MEVWDPVAFKGLLRTTSQRLGQLQERMDSNSQLTRRDISLYLAQGNLALARTKAANLIQNDMMGDLLEELEMLVGAVGKHVGELDNFRNGKPLSPAFLEAAASIIHAAPSTDSKDLHAVREVLVERLGPIFTQAASASSNNHVSARTMQILSAPTPSASKMDEYLLSIAHTFGINWVPDPRREDLPAVIAEILRTGPGSPPHVDIPRLRAICAHGLPDDPPWIRPRVWRLLFGTLPILKTTWAKESQKQRDSYYDLVRRLLAPIDSLPPPTDTPSPTDSVIFRISESLSRVSPDLFALLEVEPKGFGSGSSPLDPTAPEEIRIECASNLDKRLQLLKGDDDPSYDTPEIRLDPFSPPPSATMSNVASRRQRTPTTLLPSKSLSMPPAHQAHFSALMRLLYLHHTLNPAVQSPHIPWLLIPLYSVLAGEVDKNEVAHIEADTFWVFEALIGEVAEMEDEEGVKVWMRKLSERLKWADGDLAASLHSKGLDPVLPHYSYRWLAPLLAQTLPLSSVLPIWDVIFACPMRSRDLNPKLDYLVDICTALLVRARAPLFRLGKTAHDVPSIWTQDATFPPLSPHRPWELSDAFSEGMTLLTSYPIDSAGGIDRILQTASDLAQRRIEARDREKEREKDNVGFGTRIKESIWKGFTNQVPDDGPEEEAPPSDASDDDAEVGEHDDGDGNETETPAAPTLASRFANTVWRGITNQSSMDEVPSPPSPSSEAPSPPPELEPEPEKPPTVPAQAAPTQSSLWGYAGKLADSDAVAAFSKVSTNWRAKAMEAWSVRSRENTMSVGSPSGAPVPSSAATDIGPRKSAWPSWSDTDIRHSNQRRGSLPVPGRDSAILDPPRPAFFRSPRESFLPQPRRQGPTNHAGPDMPPPPARRGRGRDADDDASSSFMHRTKTSLTSLAPFQSQPSSPKGVPRPLMLSSHTLLSSRSRSSVRSEGGTPPQRVNQWGWGEVFVAKGHAVRQGSVSSASSMSPSEAMYRPYPYARSLGGAGARSDVDSDGGGSRKVPLNRRTVSPMALASKAPHLPWNANASPRGCGHVLSAASGVEETETETSSERGWRRFEEPLTAVPMTTAAAGMTLDSPTTISSPPVPPTPLLPPMSGLGHVRIVNGGSGGHTGTESMSTMSEASMPLEAPSQSRMILRKKTPPLPSMSHLSHRGGDDDDDDDAAAAETSDDSSLSHTHTPSARTPVRVRTKRFAPRPANLRIRENGLRVAMTTAAADRTPSPGSERLAPEWPVDHENAMTTPRVEDFGGEGGGAEVTRPPLLRKVSKETEGVRSKRMVHVNTDGSVSVRVRKVSTGSREARRTRDSGAEEGDDEGYDDLLSAYESEEGSRE